jgi:Leucine-rich repeat (LRR) protein
MYDCPKIEKLVLKELELEEEDAEFIGSLLTNYSPSLIHFELCGIFFNDLSKVFNGLKGNSTIEVLVFNKIKLTSDSMSSFLPAIETNKRLNRLDLSNNPVKDSVRQFGDYFEDFRMLRLLQLNNCAIHDDELSNLLHSLKNNTSILTLELNHNMITKNSTETISDFFILNQTIESIYMLKNKIRRPDMEKLKNHDLAKIICEE